MLTEEEYLSGYYPALNQDALVSLRNCNLNRENVIPVLAKNAETGEVEIQEVPWGWVSIQPLKGRSELGEHMFRNLTFQMWDAAEKGSAEVR